MTQQDVFQHLCHGTHLTLLSVRTRELGRAKSGQTSGPMQSTKRQIMYWSVYIWEIISVITKNITNVSMLYMKHRIDVGGRKPDIYERTSLVHCSLFIIVHSSLSCCQTNRSLVWSDGPQIGISCHRYIYVLHPPGFELGSFGVRDQCSTE